MKFIFSFLFCIVLLSPALADNTNQCANTPAYNENQCKRIGGCYYDDEDGCQRCDTHHYGASGVCHQCANETDGVWSWDPDYSYKEHSIYDATQGNNPGLASCPWFCEAGYYRGGSTNSNNEYCIPCPAHSTNCKADGDSALTYDTVQCDTGFTASRNNDTHSVGCCIANSTWNPSSGQCECNDYFFMSNDNSTCLDCPALDGHVQSGNFTNITKCLLPHSCENDDGSIKLNLIKTGNKYYCGECGFGIQTTQINAIVECDCTSVWANNNAWANNNNTPIPSGTQCVCPDGATASGNKCLCSNDQVVKRIGNTFSCAECSSIVTNSVFGSNAASSSSAVYADSTHGCVCTNGYYKSGSASFCQPCPAGHTTDPIGASARTSCIMTTNIKLCLPNTARTANGASQQCIQPVPPSSIITSNYSSN